MTPLILLTRFLSSVRLQEAGLLQQGEGGRLEPGLHSHPATLPKTGIRPIPDRVLLRAIQKRG